MNLLENEIHLYHAPFDENNPEVTRYDTLLSEAENARANRFVSEIDGLRFRYCHGLLRHLLSQYTDIPAAKIEFDSNQHDKPFLKNHHIQFNLSHTQKHLLFGFCLKHDIGVDIEMPDRKANIEALSEQVLSAQELAIFKTLSDSDKRTAFFKTWTRKEAFIKAIGMGFSFPLKDVSVLTKPHQPASIFALKSDTFNQQDFWIEDCEVSEDAHAAFVVAQAMQPVVTLFKIN